MTEQFYEPTNVFKVKKNIFKFYSETNTVLCARSRILLTKVSKIL